MVGVMTYKILYTCRYLLNIQYHTICIKNSRARFLKPTPANYVAMNTNLINEPGVYRLVFRSNKPEAEHFKHWIFHEVLPSLRKTGSYNVKSRSRRMLTGKFYTADELPAELGLREYDIVKLASDNDLLMYGFTRDCEWYFTEEGREKILNAARL